MNPDVLPHEIAISMDHVLEKILSSLDRKSLLSCRLVSQQWRLASSRVMKKKNICISFTYDEHYKAYVMTLLNCHSSEVPDVFRRNSRLQDLTYFLKIFYRTTGPFTLDKFPCNKIEIRGGSVLNPQVQTFLDTYGKYIRNLFLDYCDTSPPTTDSKLIDKMQNMLCVQVPNLEFLNISVDRYMDERRGISNIQEIKVIENQWGRNTKLHTLTVGSIRRSVFESIISISPNLRQVNLDPQDIRLLMEPVNRMYFLRALRIEVQYNPSPTLGILQQVEAAIASTSQGNPRIKFTSLAIHFTDPSPDFRLFLVKAINEILKCSWDTLKSISFKHYNATTLSGINWPPVLPKVGQITLCPPDSCGLEVFPLDRNFKIQQTFPRLQKLSFNVTADNIRNSSPEKYSKKCNLGPVLGALRLKVNVLLEQNPCDPPHIVVAKEHPRDRNFYSDSSQLAGFFEGTSPIP